MTTNICVWYCYDSDIWMDYPKLISEKWNLTAKFNCLDGHYLMCHLHYVSLVIVPYLHRCPLTLLAQYLDEHDRGKLFLFQKYAQDALVRRKQHPPQLWNWDALNIWRLNKILTESEAVLPRLTFSQPQITWLFDSEFKLQLFRKSVSKSVFYWILQN